MTLVSPLHTQHVAAGAKFAEFAGWTMPLEYAGVVAEHTAVRNHVGIFDVSHLGKARVTGPGALDALNACLTNDLRRISPGRAQYTLLCNPAGGVVDDLIAYVISEEEIFLIPNAANCATVVDILATALPDGISVINEHADHAVLAIQGPDSAAVVASLNLPAGMDYMQFAQAEHDGRPLTVCRTGYTGEHGYELITAADAAEHLWSASLAAGAQPCGLGARDTLRTEMGYSLHGLDISPEINPVEAGLSWAVGWHKPAFIGADSLRAIRAAGPRRRQRGLVATGRGIPRHGMQVLDADGAVIGQVTSGTFSPTRKVGIALALIDASFTGSQVGVQVRNRVEQFAITKPPFVRVGVRDA